MKKILFISREDVVASIKLHGPINHVSDYMYCTKDKKDWETADIVIVENLSYLFTIAKAQEQDYIGKVHD